MGHGQGDEEMGMGVKRRVAIVILQPGPSSKCALNHPSRVC